MAGSTTLYEDKNVNAILAKIDARYKDTGYALMAPIHNAGLILATPHCRVRLSTEMENISSHAVTYTRLGWQQSPENAVILGIDVAADNVDLGHLESSYICDSTVHTIDKDVFGHDVFVVIAFPEVYVRSNGREMAVRFKRRRGIVRRLLDLFGFS